MNDGLLGVIYPQGLGMNESANKRAKCAGKRPARLGFGATLAHSYTTKIAIAFSNALLAFLFFH